MDPHSSHSSERPTHGDVWERHDSHRRFSVMMVCGHHHVPHVTGYWHRDGWLDPHQHDVIPLPDFVSGFGLVEREEA